MSPARGNPSGTGDHRAQRASRRRRAHARGGSRAEAQPAPSNDWRVPLTDVAVTEQDVQAVLECLESGWLTMGPRTLAFEQALADYVGARHAVTVSSGTAALHLAHLAAGIGPGDEVIVPAFTFVASAAAARYVGAEPVLCDVVSARDFNIDPEDAAARITPRTRAIVAVHFCGYPAALDPLRELCDAHGLVLIEDCAQAIGALADDSGRQVGTVGELGAFSFFSKKQLCVGEGGMVSHRRRGARRSRAAAALARPHKQHVGPPSRPRPRLRRRRRRLQLPPRRAARGARAQQDRPPRGGDRRAAGARPRLSRATARAAGSRARIRRASRRALLALRVPGPAARPRLPRPLPRRPQGARDPDHLVPRAPHLQRVPRRPRRAAACRARWRSPTATARCRSARRWTRRPWKPSSRPFAALSADAAAHGSDGISRSRTASNSSSACS